MFYLKNKKGASLIEALIAATILVATIIMAMTGLLILTMKTIRNSEYLAQMQDDANLSLWQISEKIRNAGYVTLVNPTANQSNHILIYRLNPSPARFEYYRDTNNNLIFLDENNQENIVGKNISNITFTGQNLVGGDTYKRVDIAITAIPQKSIPEVSSLTLRTSVLGRVDGTTGALLLKPNGTKTVYPSIQAAINAASYTDRIYVSGGTYKERITLKSGVSLRGGYIPGFQFPADYFIPGHYYPPDNDPSRDLNVFPTIIDGQNLGAAVYGNSIDTVVFQGFTVKNGTSGYGGGIEIQGNSKSLTISYNTVMGNTGTHSAGIYVACNTTLDPRVPIELANIAIFNNTVTGNTVTSTNPNWGSGGIYVGYVDRVIIKSNTVTNNIGGCISGILVKYLYSSGWAKIGDPDLTDAVNEGNIVDNNTNGSYGAGILVNYDGYVEGITVTVTNNTITNNIGTKQGSTAYWVPGGLGVNFAETITIKGNTVTGNKGGYFAGLYNEYLYQNGSATIGGTNTGEGNTISGNTDGYYGSGLLVNFRGYVAGITVTVTNNTITNNIGTKQGSTSYWVPGGLGVNFAERIIVNKNLVAKNSGGYIAGAYIYYDPTVISFLNCTIADNTNGSTGAGLGRPSNLVKMAVKNSIIYGNSGDLYNISNSPPTNQNLSLTYCDIDKGSFAGAGNNINSDPLFVNSNTGDYHLQDLSPCKGTGDPAGTNRGVY